MATGIHPNFCSVKLLQNRPNYDSIFFVSYYECQINHQDPKEVEAAILAAGIVNGSVSSRDKKVRSPVIAMVKRAILLGNETRELKPMGVLPGAGPRLHKSLILELDPKRHERVPLVDTAARQALEWMVATSLEKGLLTETIDIVESPSGIRCVRYPLRSIEVIRSVLDNADLHVEYLAMPKSDNFNSVAQA